MHRRLKKKLAASSLRAKIMLSVGLIIVAVLGVATVVYVRDFQRNYREAFEWRTEALAQIISSQILTNQQYDPDYYVNDPRMLEAFSLQCMQLYEQNQQRYIAHIAVINAAGTIAAHNEKTLWQKPVESAVLRQALMRQQFDTVLDQTVYHTLIPLFSPKQVYLGSIDIGFPQAIVHAKVDESLLHIAILFCLVLLVALTVISILMQRIVTKPIGGLVTVGCQLAQGNPVQIAAGTSAEITTLETVFNNIAAYFQHLTDIAGHITTGIIDSTVQIRSERDLLGNAVQRMLDYLNTVAAMAARIADGDLREQFSVNSEQDRFGRAMQAMITGLRAIVLRIRGSARQIAATGADISTLAAEDIMIVAQVNTATEQMSSTMHELGASVDEVAHHMGTLAGMATQTSGAVSQMASASKQIAGNTTELKAQTVQTTDALQAVVASLYDVAQDTAASQYLSQETLQDARAGQESVEQVMRSMSGLQTTITAAVEDITNFALRSHDIDRILDVIREIADRTSLLSFNAAIIAAQAGGVHGRGFAVVADEIKDLAEGVASSTKEIAVIVHNLERDTQAVVQIVHAGAVHVAESQDRTCDAQQALQKILSSTERSSTIASNIAGALVGVQQMNSVVVTAMEQIDHMTDEIASAAAEQQAVTSQIHQTVEVLDDMASEITCATTQQAKGIQEALQTTLDVAALMALNLASSQRVTDTTKDLSAQADGLLHAVERFQLEISTESARVAVQA